MSLVEGGEEEEACTTSSLDQDSGAQDLDTGLACTKHKGALQLINRIVQTCRPWLNSKELCRRYIVQILVCLHLVYLHVAKPTECCHYLNQCCRIAGQRLRFYCSDCDTAVCASCADIECGDHRTAGLAAAMADQRAGLTETVQQARDSRVAELERAVRAVAEIQQSLEEKEQQLQDEINDTFDKLAARLEERRVGLVGQVRVRAGGKLDRLESQQAGLQTDLAHLTSACDLVERVLEGGSAAQLLLMRKQVVEAGLGGGADKPGPPVETDYLQLELAGLADTQTAITRLGSVTSSSCIPGCCVAGGSGLRRAVAAQRTSITLTTRDAAGAVTAGPGLAEVSCHLEAVGGIPAGQLSRLIQVQVRWAAQGGTQHLVWSVPGGGRGGRGV